MNDFDLASELQGDGQEARPTFDEALDAIRRPPAECHPAPSEDQEARCGWEVRDNDGQPPFSIERGSEAGGDLEIHVAGLYNYDEAERIETALNDPVPEDQGDRARCEANRIRGRFQGHDDNWIIERLSGQLGDARQQANHLREQIEALHNKDRASAPSEKDDRHE